MEDIVTCLLLLLDFQLYMMAMQARNNSEIILLAFIDIFIWTIAVLGNHK